MDQQENRIMTKSNCNKKHSMLNITFGASMTTKQQSSTLAVKLKKTS